MGHKQLSHSPEPLSPSESAVPSDDDHDDIEGRGGLPAQSSGEDSTEQELNPDSERQRRPLNGRCKCDSIDDYSLARVIRIGAEFAGIKGSEAGLSTLKEFLDVGPTLDHVCFKHLQGIAGHLGHQVKMLTVPDLKERLILFWEHRRDIDSWKTSETTKNWWRVNNRP